MWTRPTRRTLRRLAALGWLIGVVLLARPGRATIAEQRARLPPAAECADETVAGVWRSHQYIEHQGEWYVFTLWVRRVPDHPEQLVGRITSQYWRGGREMEQPPSCQDSSYQFTIGFDARGRVDPDGSIHFGGVGDWEVERNPCGARAWGYNLDQFSGVIDPAILEFQSVNNDGGAFRNVPTVFRRIRCPPQESAQAPSVNTSPPDFYPDRGGCSLL